MDKQCRPRSDCSYKSSLFWVHTVYLYTYIINNVSKYMHQMTLDEIFRCSFFACAFKVFVCFDSLHPSLQFFSHVSMGLPGLNQY